MSTDSALSLQTLHYRRLHSADLLLLCSGESADSAHSCDLSGPKSEYRWYTVDRTREEEHLCISLLGFFFGHRPKFVACGQSARFKKIASLLCFYSFRGSVIFFSSANLTVLISGSLEKQR
jgi:hypothetical protein